MTTKQTTNDSGKKGLNWKEVTIGGVSGILLGGAGTFAATHSNGLNEGNPADNPTDENKENGETLQEQNLEGEATVIELYGNVASGVNDNMSFSEAFTTARNEVGVGGCFVWHGNVYGTYNANEWNSLTQSQRDEFVNHTTGVDTSHSHTTHHSYSHHSSAHNQDQSPEKPETPSEEAVDEEEMMVEVLGVEQVQHEDGSVSNIGAASINGQAVYFIDVDGQDDEFELMAVDINANGSLEENEITDISDQHMSVSQFQNLAEASGNSSEPGHEVEEYYASNENLPDYVNDADPDSLA